MSQGIGLVYLDFRPKSPGIDPQPENGDFFQSLTNGTLRK